MNSGDKKPLLREKGYFESLLWGFVFFLIFANVALKIVSDYWAAVDEYEISRDLDMIHEFEQAQEKADFSIILLGTSRLRHALDPGLQPQKLTILPNGKKVAVLQIGVDAGSFSKLDYMIDEIKNAHPDIIFIDRFMLSNDSRGGGEKGTSMLWTAAAISGYIQRALIERHSLEDGWRIDRHGRYFDCHSTFPKSLLEETLAFNKQRDFHDPQGEEPAKGRAFINEMLDRGTQVVIYYLTTYKEKLEEYGYEPYMLDTGNMDHAPTRQELLPENYDRVIWDDFEMKGKDELFCDLSHYTDKGRAKSNAWFINKFTELGDKL